MHRHMVRELRRALGLIVDMEALASNIHARLHEMFDPDTVLLLHLDQTSGRYLPTYNGRSATDPVPQVPADGHLSRWLRVNESCLLLPRDRAVYDYLRPAEQQVLDRFGIRLLAPLLAANHLSGMILLGWTRPRYLNSRDAELLQEVAEPASLALENALLYHEQRERLDRLHKAERLAAIGQLAAGVAHEVRNPLAAIRSTMQYLAQRPSVSRRAQSSEARDGTPEEEWRTLVGDLITEVDRIDATVNDLLGLARSGDLRTQRIDPLLPLQQAVRLLAAKARKQKVQLESSFELGCFEIEGDGDRLKQVFLNLLINALQATPAGGRIRSSAGAWSTTTSRGARPWVEISITDTGSGISQDQLARIFDPFFTTKRDGTGLGLAVCQSIVERHGGRLRLQSRPRQGTIALVRLPWAATAAGET